MLVQVVVSKIESGIPLVVAVVLFRPPSTFKMTIVEDIKHAVGLDGPSNRKKALAFLCSLHTPMSSGQARPSPCHGAQLRAIGT